MHHNNLNQLRQTIEQSGVHCVGEPKRDAKGVGFGPSKKHMYVAQSLLLCKNEVFEEVDVLCQWKYLDVRSLQRG